MKEILWIDDDPIRFLQISHLKGIRVTFAHGAEQIAYYLEDSGVKFDLIILDHDMPLMSGMEVCEKFLVERNIPVILCSMNSIGIEEQYKFLKQYDSDEYRYPVWKRPVTNKDALCQKIKSICKIGG